ncbi:MAG: Trk system potassium transporter TrkA [Candidatus Omnitrophica bacterium]|nr:Trk system potassium transporter TrkA [Candidatus Omnitrophota bacterium]
MKTVVAGLGPTGRMLASFLQKEKHDLILIDQKIEAVQHARERFDAQIECGDTCDPTVLEPIIDDTVDFFIALTPDDKTNIISTLIARKFGVKRAIVRIGDPNNFIHPLLTEDPNVSMLNAEMIVSKELMHLVSTPAADEVEFFAKGKAEIARFHIPKGAPILGNKLCETVMPPTWIVAALIRKGHFVIASGDTILEAEDEILVVGNPKRHGEVESILGLKSPNVKRVVVVGYNSITSKLVRALTKRGVEVRIIEETKEMAEKAAATLDKALVFQGDATDEAILDQAGISETDYLIALTDDDETNVLVSLLAKEKRVPHVATITQKTQYNRVIQKIGIDTSINPRAAMVNELVRVMHRGDLLDINILEGGQGRMIEFEVHKKTKLIGKELSKIKLPKQILIGAIVRGEELIIPRGKTKLQINDHVVVFTTMSIVSEVKKLFGH